MTVNSAGQIDDLKVADFADFVPGAANPLTVWDRDTNGQIYGCHTGGASSTVASSAFQNTTVACGASSSFRGPKIGLNTTAVGRGGMLLIPKSDGLSDGQNTIQGVRTYDPQAGVWTTPDPYRGDVHDPMSQKPYMWNRNNPYQYSDPSGYFAEVYVNGNDIRIVIPVRFGGDANTAQTRSAIAGLVELAWTGDIGKISRINRGRTGWFRLQGKGEPSQRLGFNKPTC